MCGIVYVHGSKRSVPEALNMYQKQKHRGTQGYGAITFEGNTIKSVHRSEYETEIKNKLKDEIAESILFHHRFPTSTGNYVDATHPIKVSHKSLEYDYYFVHNGVISNADVLKTKHEKLGFEYRTRVKTKVFTRNWEYTLSTAFNDSEALAIEFALTVEGKKEKSEAWGAAAFVAVQITKGEKREVKAILFGRNDGNPLMLKRKKDAITLASEGKGKNIKANTLFTLENGVIVESRPFVVSGYTVYVPPVNDRKYEHRFIGFSNDLHMPSKPKIITASPDEMAELQIELEEYEALLHIAKLQGNREEITEMTMLLEDVKSRIKRHTKVVPAFTFF